MNREQWRDLQRALHPKDLESVQRFAEKLLLNHPFVFAFNGSLSVSLDGPGVHDLAESMVAELVHGLPPASAHAMGGADAKSTH